VDADSPEVWRWIWLVAAAVFAGGEIFIAGTFFLLSFAVGAAAAAIAAFLGAHLIVQWVLFVGGSAAALLVLRPISRRLDRDQGGRGIGATRWEGRTAKVLQKIPAGLHETGLVRVDREEWRAESGDGREIPADAVVRVTAVRGTRLIVEPTTHARWPHTDWESSGT
jgi:membrane protein implicated in regulation of membrane protease activity